MTRSFNLPPGCSTNDLPGNDPDECPMCEGLGTIEIMRTRTDENGSYHVIDTYTCPDCSGLGVVNTPSKGDHSED